MLWDQAARLGDGEGVALERRAARAGVAAGRLPLHLRPDLVRYVYIERFERGSLVWLFVVYRTKDGWRLNTISWNPDLIHAFPGS